ncbi:MFS general substrate transporter [Russula ochroleuca]|uniref:MFS general substrate transporter n=1 Tax=Russula ochroleuca TaxID=152965 RepID=A0A9P5N4X6_9AGAM|nr:MFS general substrate transporter [Russula ochroleuca]
MPDSPTSLDRISWSGPTDEIDEEKRYEVQLGPEDDPQRLSLFRRWLAVVTISSCAHFVTFASSVAAFSLGGVSESFHVGREVAILSMSLYVVGLGIGPLFAGPISEIYGRNIVYRMSFALFFVFSFPVAFAPDIGTFLIFRFATGFCGAAFLSVAGGSVSDMFPNATVGTPMAVYSVTTFLGPELGLPFSGFINQNVSWRWTYYALIIWSLLQTVALICFVPETYTPVILKWKAQRLRKSGGNKHYYAPLEKADISLGRSIFVSCYKPFQLLSDHMIFLIDLWCALILGILYLTFEVFPIIFTEKHNFNMQMTGLTFLGIAFGNLIGLATTPYWNRRYRLFLERNGNPPPEFRLVMGQVGGILVSISLFCLAFTTYKDVHWIVPVIASVPFGTGTYFVFSSSFTYLVVTYRPIAASAMASNSAMRSSFAAAFPLFASQMYHRLGTVGATALIAGLATAMAPLPFVFYHVGEKLRAKSKFAV